MSSAAVETDCSYIISNHQNDTPTYTCFFRRNGTECNQRNLTERKENVPSVPLEVTVGRFPQFCSYRFRPKVDF
uniref:Uncharacterized protein n=1 Tax=Romanomermis culicivorax TaxID=13658 RepID=A0A915LAW9_ROMCU